MFRALCGGALVGACSPPAPKGPKLLTLAEAEYQNTPKNIMSCATCSFFEAPEKCKVVAGKVNANGYCKLYAQVD